MKTNRRTATRVSIAMLTVAVLAGCGKPQSPTKPPRVDLHEAVIRGNLEAIQQHIVAGSDLNQRAPAGGASPLITAAAFGQTDAAKALIEAGADLNCRNNEGSTALHTAAFLCRTEIVEMLVANGADKNLTNNAGATALDSVTGPFNEVKGVYDLLTNALAPLGLRLDYDRIRAMRPQIADRLR